MEQLTAKKMKNDDIHKKELFSVCGPFQKIWTVVGALAIFIPFSLVNIATWGFITLWTGKFVPISILVGAFSTLLLLYTVQYAMSNY
jgi:hypothetical protein